MNNDVFEEFLNEVENIDKEEGVVGRWVKTKISENRKAIEDIVREMIENEKRDRR